METVPGLPGVLWEEARRESLLRLSLCPLPSQGWAGTGSQSQEHSQGRRHDASVFQAQWLQSFKGLNILHFLLCLGSHAEQSAMAPEFQIYFK